MREICHAELAGGRPAGDAPAGGPRLRVIAYDVVSDRRRKRSEKLLSGYGTRVQYGAFHA